MAEPKQNMSQSMKEEHGNIKGLSYENSRGSLFWKTVWYVGTRPINLIFYGISWFHLYSLCQFGRLHKNIPVLLLCLVWWIGVTGYDFYLWICYSRKRLLSESWSCVSEIKAEDVKWYIRRDDYCQIFLKDKSVVTTNLQELGHDEKDFLDLKLSTVNALGKKKYRLAAGIFLAIVAVFGCALVIKSAMPYHGKLSWYLDDLQDKRSVTLVHDNVYESGVEGVMKDIRDKVKLPEKLCLATSFNLHFAPDGTIQTFDTMLCGFDENGDFVDSYLITYKAARSKKIDIYLGGAKREVFDIDKDFKPLIEAVSVMPLKETVAEWSGQESFGILYYGAREWHSSEGIRYLNHKGESRMPSAEEYYFSGYSVSVFCPENEAIVPVRYLYMGYQDFPMEEVGYIADYYPEESSSHMAYDDLTGETGHMADDEAETEEYVVKKGDTLWKIAEEMLGASFRYAEIYELNKATIEETAQNKGKKDSGDGYWIFQGTLLRMPEQTNGD